MNSLFQATLAKTSGANWEVGGVASAFLQDLDGEAITPEAVREAIPAFMASRGTDGLSGGPIRLHHNFWESFLKRAIASLGLPTETQLELVAAISLPLGRVTKIWIDEQGTTHWRGLLSQANPIAKIIWQMLKENLVHLGVSVGGKILQTVPGRDRLGRLCTLISKIRLDELSVTDNPALRLTQGEDASNGAYISALAKSASTALRGGTTVPIMNMAECDRWLKKALSCGKNCDCALCKGASSYGAMGDARKEFASVKGEYSGDGLARGMNSPKSQLMPKGNAQIKTAPTETRTGLGGNQPQATQQRGSSQIKTDIWGLSVGQLTRTLSKCGCMSKEAWSSPETITLLTDSTAGLTQAMDDPHPAMLNLARFLQQVNSFAQQLPYMSDYQAAGTIDAMNGDLMKALETFKEAVPKTILEQPLRPPGSPKIVRQDVMLPQQYILY